MTARKASIDSILGAVCLLHEQQLYDLCRDCSGRIGCARQIGCDNYLPSRTSSFLYDEQTKLVSEWLGRRLRK